MHEETTMGKQQSPVKWLNRPLVIVLIIWLFFTGIIWVIDRPVKDDVVVITITLPVSFGLLFGAGIDITKEEMKSKGINFIFPRKIALSCILWLVAYYLLAFYTINQQLFTFQLYLVAVGIPIGIAILGIPLYQMEKLGKATMKHSQEQKETNKLNHQS